jgi:phage-related protein
MSADWLTYLGAVTGVVGTITGITACRRTSKYKTLDLRIQLHKDVRELSHDCTQLPGTISYGLQSRQRVSAANGMGRSGAAKLFEEACQADSQRVERMAEQLVQIDSLDDNSDTLSVLERRLVEVHGIRVEVAQLKSKYQSAMTQDDRARDHIRRSHERPPRP